MSSGPHHLPLESFFNWAAFGSVIGSLVGWLPSIAAALGVVWYCILIYDRLILQKRK